MGTKVHYRVWYWTRYERGKGVLTYMDYGWKSRSEVEAQVKEWHDDHRWQLDSLDYIEMIEEVHG